MHLAVPYLTLEPLLGKLSASYWYSSVRRGATERSSDQVTDLRVPSSVYRETEPLSIARLGRLARGDMLPFAAGDKGCPRLEIGGVVALDLNARVPDEDGVYGVDSHGTDRTSGDDIEGIDAWIGTPKESTAVADAIRKPLDVAVSELRASIARIADGVDQLRQSQQDVLDQLVLSSGPRGDTPRPKAYGSLEFLRPEDAGYLALILQREHPQIVACLLAEADPKVGALVLSALPEDLQVEVTRRISVSGRVAEEVAQLAYQFVRERIETAGPGVHREGIQSAVELLNLVNRSTEANVIRTLEQVDPELAEGIKIRMFVFEDITLLDERSLGTVLAEVAVDDLALSLKGIPGEIREPILSSMDEERRRVVEEKERELGRVRYSDVEAAQQRIVVLIRRLERDGRVFVARPDEMVE